MAPADPLLRLINVTKRFDGVGDASVSVLAGIDLTVERGESLAIVGPSGSGKSTLLNIIGTLDTPSSGTIELEGQNLSQVRGAALAALRNRCIGFVFQAHYLLPQCTVFENVLVPTLATNNEVIRDGAPDRARRLLERVGLGRRLKHRPGQLSGGERQRVAVVRALINEPQLLLADEPTGALDRVSADQLGQMLLDLNRETRVTLIVVTHALSLAGKMERMLELRDGRLDRPRDP